MKNMTVMLKSNPSSSGATETADGISRTRRPRPNSSPEVLLGKEPVIYESAGCWLHIV